CRLDTA
ncbi:hypothetical protein CFC21_059070, partial [Triticum aestivum]